MPEDEKGTLSLPFADPHDKGREVRDVFGEGPDVGARAFGATMPAKVERVHRETGIAKLSSERFVPGAVVLEPVH